MSCIFLCVVYPSLRNAEHTAIYFPLQFDQTMRDQVLQRSERQQGTFPIHGGVSVVICCKKKTKQKSSYPYLPIDFTHKEEEHAVPFIPIQRSSMQACSHTRVVLLSIVRMQVLAAVPLLFTALHMYSPSSSGKVSGR